MNPEDYVEMAACGLQCGPCPLRRLTFDEKAAERVVAWFRREGWLEEDEGVSEIIERSMYCTGCHGDRSTHWSADCWILRCCVDEKGLSDCSECEMFPCGPLVEWSEENESYGRALERLRAKQQGDFGDC